MINDTKNKYISYNNQLLMMNIMMFISTSTSYYFNLCMWEIQAGIVEKITLFRD